MPREPRRRDEQAPDEQADDLDSEGTPIDELSMDEPDDGEPPDDAGGTDTLQGDGPNIGDTVICTNRLPSPIRPWEHPIWIGSGTDPSRWSGKYSEAAFCKFSKRRRVRYRNPDDANDTFVQHDKVDSLIVLSEDEANLAGLEAVRHFRGVVAAHQYQQHQRKQPEGSK